MGIMCWERIGVFLKENFEVLNCGDKKYVSEDRA